MSRTHQVRMNTARLLWRQYVSDRGAAWTVMIVVLLLALATALAPRALDRMYTDDLHTSVEVTPASLRDLSSVSPIAPPLDTGDDPWAGFAAGLAEVRKQADPLALDVLGEPRFYSSTHDVELEQGGAEAALATFIVADPFVADLVDVVEGTAPAVFDRRSDPVLEVMVSKAGAEALAWEVGEEREAGVPPPGGPLRLRLAGIYDVHDPAADAWLHRRAAIEPDVFDDFNAGLRYTSAVYVHPASYAGVLEATFGVASTRMWLPVDVSAITASQVGALRDSLAKFGSSVYRLDPGTFQANSNSYRTVSDLAFTTKTVSVLDTVEARRTGSAAILAIVAAGPIGVAMAVLTLASRLMIERRRSALALASARGASPAQFRWWLGLEGLAIGIPAAVGAWLLASVLIPGDPNAVGIVLPAVVGLSPAVLLPVAGRPSGLRTVRRDIGLERPSRARRFVEALVVVAAIAACVALNMRGLEAGEGGVDPLLAATPLLVAFAVTMVVMRLYPAPVAAIGRRLRRGRSTVAYLGTARATRDPAGGLVPMLALVVGLSIAAFSVVMWSTTEQGLKDTAWHEVGADARLVGSAPTEEQFAAGATVPGIDVLVPVSTPGPIRFQSGPDTTRFPLTATDVRVVADLHDGRGETAVPTGIVGLTADGAVPIATSSDGPQIGTTGQLFFGARPVDAVVVEHVDEVPGLNPTGSSWVLVDRDTVADAGIPPLTFRTVLVDAAAGTDVDYAAVIDALGGAGTVTTPDDVAGAMRGPVNEGTAVAIVAAIALTGLLCAASVVLTLVVSAPSRGRLLAQLRTLGLTGRQGEGLVAWETAPVAIASLVSGLLVGVTLPWLILGGLDLSALTGGRSQPSIVVPYGYLLALLAAFVAVVAAAVGGSVLAVRRLRPASVLRVGDE